MVLDQSHVNLTLKLLSGEHHGQIRNVAERCIGIFADDECWISGA